MKIIDSFKEDEAVNLYDDGKMLDFLPQIKPESTLDLDVMEKWQRYFERMDIPYLVLKEVRKICPNPKVGARSVYVLYKENRV